MVTTHPTALRGKLVSFTGDPFLVDPASAFVHETDGLVVCRDGIIAAVGPYDRLRSTLPKDVPITDYSGCIISAGFIDTHVHYVQTGIIAAPGKQLLQWVSDYVYPVEEAFADEAHARAVASMFCDTLLRNGTTTACVYCAVYPQSVDALFAAAAQRRMRMIAGKCMMDRNVPQALRDTAKIDYDESKALIGNGTGKNGSSMPSRRAGPDRARRPSSRRQAPCGASTPSCTYRPNDDAGRRPRRARNLRGGAATRTGASRLTLEGCRPMVRP
jgi:guanine deaminase